MKKIWDYIKAYSGEVDKPHFALCSVFIALAIFINYYYGLNNSLSVLEGWKQFAGWYLVFTIVFSFAYLTGFFMTNSNPPINWKFLGLLLLAPAIFAWKMSYDVDFFFSADGLENSYWNQVIYWPFKLIVIMAMVWIAWKIFDRDNRFYTGGFKALELKPYLLMLLMMVPLIAAASTQADFLAMYPKMKNVLDLSERHDTFFHKLLYELSYGSDFIGIEVFFRGFLVLAFIKFAGRDAILPMAMFYCTIHFGKPLGECISSFFGGLLLGIITYHTRSIWGGLIVHLGIAWLMELGGFLGNMTS